MADLRLFIIADDPLARAGLSALLGDQGDWEVVGQSSAGESLAAEIDRLRPDVIVWDLGWEPKINIDYGLGKYIAYTKQIG